MVNLAKLRGVMAEQAITGREMARQLGMAEPTWYGKIKTGKFGADEMYAISRILELTDAEKLAIFFDNGDY